MRRAAAALAVALALSACGTRTDLLGSRATSVAPASAGATGLVGGSASPTEVRVIRGWSDALRRGDVAGAAQYFAIPRQMINGTASGEGILIRIRSRHDAVLANESLPCGATFLSAVQHGRFVDALFALSGRPGPGGSTCAGAVGATARTFFLIVSGRIRTWIRAPDQPGPGPAAPAPAAPPGPIA